LHASILPDKVARQLEDEGVEKLDQPFDKLMDVLRGKPPRHLKRAQ
jgi:hypothetical protein